MAYPPPPPTTIYILFSNYTSTLPPSKPILMTTPAVSPNRRSNPAATATKHPVYRGIRRRSGKWVSEICEPRKSKRIWLGTYPSPEMAAAAYDVACLSLKGRDAVLNFPDFVGSYPVPALPEPAFIRSAAGAAAELMKYSALVAPDHQHEISAAGDHEVTTAFGRIREFMDEEEIFDMPNLLVDMAGGMLMSPPRPPEFCSPGDPSASDHHSCDNLWNY